MALWDLAGREAGLPVAKLLGGARDRVKAYASTYPNIGSPEEYAQHALACRSQGYLAYKIHPHYFWDPATRRPRRVVPRTWTGTSPPPAPCGRPWGRRWS